VEISGRDVIVRILEDRRQGPGLAIANPYSGLPDSYGSVALRHAHTE
jgi:hypothetical protein